MISKLLYDPKTKKKLHPRFKFNCGRGAILCHKCGKIIKENVSLSDLKCVVENLFCLDCAIEMLVKIFKTKKDDNKENQ